MSGLILTCRGRALNLRQRTHVMGIINCTPDSFYEKSRVQGAEEAIRIGTLMAQAGADILDIGGESSRPGADPVSAAEELERVLPVVAGLAQAVDVPLSIDTYRANVARKALAAGANMINDISALTFDRNLGEVVAEHDVPVVLMHMKGKPKTMHQSPVYSDLMGEILSFFEERVEYAISQGIKETNIILDPGIGFGKRLNDNYTLINQLSVLLELGFPMLVGVSRKSFISKVLNTSTEEALEGTLAMTTASILHGAHLIRAHDVSATRRVATVTDYLLRQKRTDE